MDERRGGEARESDEPGGLPEFVKQPWGIVRRRWRWMALALLLVGGAAASFVWTRPVTYQASARLLLSSQRVPEDFVRQITIEGMSERVNAIVGQILSNDSLEELVEKHDYAERAGAEGTRKQILDGVRKSISVEPASDMQTRSRGPSTTYIFVIRFTSRDPELAADMANGLVSRFTAAHAERQTRQTKLTTEFLEREAERVRKELESVRKKIAEFTKRHRGQLPSELDTKLARLTRLQQQRDSLSNQLSEAESRLLALRRQGSDERTALLAELRSRLVNELAVNTPEHPNVKALRRQISQLEEELRENPAPREGTSASPAAVEVQQEIRSLRRQIASVEEEIERLDADVSAIPEREEELASLQQREELLQEKYAEASRKVSEAELSESLQRAQQGFNVTVLEPAWPPTEPESATFKFAVLGVVGSLGAALGIAVFLELWDPVLLTPMQLERHAGMATLGVVPRIR